MLLVVTVMSSAGSAALQVVDACQITTYSFASALPQVHLPPPCSHTPPSRHSFTLQPSACHAHISTLLLHFSLLLPVLTKALPPHSLHLAFRLPMSHILPILRTPSNAIPKGHAHICLHSQTPPSAYHVSSHELLPALLVVSSSPPAMFVAIRPPDLHSAFRLPCLTYTPLPPTPRPSLPAMLTYSCFLHSL
jgi:hypothetical protein